MGVVFILKIMKFHTWDFVFVKLEKVRRFRFKAPLNMDRSMTKTSNFMQQTGLVSGAQLARSYFFQCLLFYSQDKTGASL